MTTMITSATLNFFEIMITNKQTKTNVIFIVMTSMITSARTTLFEIMITNKQINKPRNKYIVKMNVILLL